MRFLGQGCSRTAQQKPNRQIDQQCRAQGIPLVSVCSHEIQLAFGIAITWPSRVAENVGTRIITKGHLRLVHAGNTGYCRFLGGHTIHFPTQFFQSDTPRRVAVEFCNAQFCKNTHCTVGSRRSPSAKAECVLRTHIGVQIAPLHGDNRPAKNQPGDRSRQLSVIRSLGLIARFGWLLPPLATSRLPRPGPLRSISWSHQP